MEENLREIISSVALLQSRAGKWLEFVERDEISEKLSSEEIIQNLKTEIQNLDKKLNILLDSFLESVVDSETYKQKKNEFFEKKIEVQEKIATLDERGSTSLEPLREFINVASQCEKIARAKNNCEDWAIFAKRVGSNFFLSDRQLSADFKKGFSSLSAHATALKADPVRFADSLLVE